MKLALLSDIHANLQALEACLQHARDQGATDYAFLGDLVGYGADPKAVVQWVMALHAEGAVVLQGNHDLMAVQPPPSPADNMASRTAAWTHAQLGEPERAFLASLPLSHQQGGTLLVHASAQSPEKWIYVDDERRAEMCLLAATSQQAKRVFVGHVHHQGIFYLGARNDVMHFQPTSGVAVPMLAHRSWVCTVGSVGQPRDGNPRAMYAIYEERAQRVTFHRVPYDIESAAVAIRQAGLPDMFAARLEEGR